MQRWRVDTVIFYSQVGRTKVYRGIRSLVCVLFIYDATVIFEMCILCLFFVCVFIFNFLPAVLYTYYYIPLFMHAAASGFPKNHDIGRLLYMQWRWLTFTMRG